MANEKKVKPDPAPKVVDILGKVREERLVMQDVVVGKGDHGDIVARKEVPTQIEVVGSHLEIEEAGLFDIAGWSKLDDEHYTRKAMGTCGYRRFVIHVDTYNELCEVSGADTK